MIFQEKCFWYYILLTNPSFIVWLPVLLEILGNMFIAITCYPDCNVINFEINLILLINPNKAGLFEVSFFWGWGVGGCLLTPPSLHVSRRTYLITIKLLTIIKKSIQSVLKVKKWLHHVLYAHVIGFFVTSKCKKIQKFNENRWKYLILTEKFFITSEQLEEFQLNFSDLW